MAGPILYSTNPWISHQIAEKYRKGIHFAWVSEFYDGTASGATGPGAAIAPSSTPRHIYDTLWSDVDREDTHSALIKGYRKTFKRLANTWHAAGEITKDDKDEIIATVDSRSWKIWRPTLYVIPNNLISPATRILSVPHRNRAAYGPEMQISDLKSTEFDLIEVRK